MAMFGALPAMSAAAPGAVEQMSDMMPRKRPGMFGAGKGNIGEIIGALLSGFSAAKGNPAGMAGLQMLHQRRQQAAEQEQYGQRREDDFQDWVRKQAYQQANPNPVNNDTVADYEFITKQLGPEAGKEYLRNRANPPRLQFVPGIGLIDASQMGGGQSAPPPGVTFTPIDEGGPAPQGPGGFR